MSWYVWDKSLDIKVDKMNDEHKVLINLMNQLHDEAEAKVPKFKLLKTFEDLAKYTRQHFAEEEQFMDSIEYPDIKAHKMIHTRLLTQLDEHLQGFRKGTGEVSPDIFSFLKMWLNAHIKGIDIKYGNHAQTHLPNKAKAG